jgi:hypothetical protein
VPGRDFDLDLDPDELAGAFGREVSSYDVEPIDPHLRIHSVTGGVYRVRAGEQTAVLKVVRHATHATADGLWGADADVGGRNYWKREWLAFDSGLLAGLAGGLRAPRTLLTTEPSPDECWIWLEDVAGRTGSGLLDADYARIAADLGATQGAYASGGAPLPDQPWLSRRWLRGWVDACAGFVAETTNPRVHALWERRDDLLDIVESAPQTVVHCDFWPTNLFVTDTGTVAIDWSQVGLGSLAQDLDQVTLDPIWMQVRPRESPDALEVLVLPAYAVALRGAGCDVTDGQARRWYAAAAGAHYSWLGGPLAERRHTPEQRASMEARFGRPYDEVAADRLRVVEHALGLGEWALGSAS